ncbi:MAG: NADH-quinone oxidoreductase subunit L [Campylobacterota bacterium]|nr:NADH-quinone oxidoreductase subunit L [Campylobacterota bacterium]
MNTLLILIVILPFFSAAIMGLLYLSGYFKGENIYRIIGIASPVLITVFTFILGSEVLNSSSDFVIKATLFNWLSIGDFIIELELIVDRLSMVMISFITFIGTLIHIYASGYMKGDAGFGKFFAFFNFFLGSMLLLVLAANPIIMFIGWELVGLASYLLIGFYHQESANMSAANKAFIVNRVGDFGFIIGLALLFVALEGRGFSFEAIQHSLHIVDNSLLHVIGIMLFIGAMGKSAQIPLYVWLPDAMAGPTPVSALIHAATMVTAGVYMVARFSFLYVEIPSVGVFIASIGIASALFAAIIASFQSDIKKILAYSTMSQLGYMFVAVGLGAYSSGVFHVFTHAFFKALLFMGAGAIIIALHHEQNIFKMGGLKKSQPLLFITMLIATLSISGIPLFSGFFSKDAILVHAFAEGQYLIWGLGVITAFLTAYYMFRMFFIVFITPEKEKHHLLHVSFSMKWPLLILAIGAAFAGFLAANEAYGGSSWFAHFIGLPDRMHHLSHQTEYMLDALNVAVAIVGISLAYRLFSKEAIEPKEDTPLRRLIINKFYIDEIYDTLFVKPLRRISTLSDRIIDGWIIDGLLNGLVFSYRSLALTFSSLQNGKVRFYALYILMGISIISLSVLSILMELS